MRIVLDNNVWVSALIQPAGLSGRLRAAWQDGQFVVVTSPDQIARLRDVLQRTKFAQRFHPADVRTLMDDIASAATIVEPRRDIVVSRDPEDNLILGTAIAGREDCIVTGDKRDLLHLKQVEGVPILTSREAINLLFQRDAPASDGPDAQ